MTQINVGTPNGKDGDKLRDAFVKLLTILDTKTDKGNTNLTSEEIINLINNSTGGFPTESFTVVLSNNKTLGKYSNGDIIPVYNNSEEMLKDLGIERIAPTIKTNKSVSISTSPNLSSSIEIGSSLDFDISHIFNRGLIESKDGSSDVPLVGDETARRYTGVYTQPPFDPEVDDNIQGLVTEGTMRWTVSVDHSTGTDTYYDSAGNPANDLDSSRAMGTVTRNLDITGRYKIFAGATNNLPTNRAEALVFDKGFENTSSVDFRSGTNNLTFFVAKKQVSGSPSSISGNNIDGLNAPINLTNKTTMDYELPNGSIVIYDVWSITINNPYSTNDLLRFNV